ncbi:hypothetical protein D3C77_603860 [compost metagenome]
MTDEGNGSQMHNDIWLELRQQSAQGWAIGQVSLVIARFSRWLSSCSDNLVTIGP